MLVGDLAGVGSIVLQTERRKGQQFALDLRSFR